MTSRRYGGSISRSSPATASAWGKALVGSIAALLRKLALGRARLDVLDQRAERVKVRRQVLRLIDHEPKPLLDADRQLDEVERIEPERSFDILGQRGGQGKIGEPARRELEPLHHDVLQLFEHLVGLHPHLLWTSWSRPTGRTAPRCRRS